MNYSYKLENDVLHLSLDGRLDTEASVKFDVDFAAIIKENPHGTLVLDASELQYIASSGLRTILKMAKSGKYDAVICLGAVIRGATSHYDYVCNEVSKGIATVSINSDIPVMFGVVTTENIEQAIERAGTKAGNKGYDCALGAIEMVNLIRNIEA